MTIEGFAIELVQCVLCIVALNISPPTIRNTRKAMKVPEICCPILTKFGVFSTDFRKSRQYKISLKSVRLEPR